MSKTEIPEVQLKLYNDLIAAHPYIDRKGKTTPYTSMNGHMFSFLDKEGKMGLRLSKDALAAFLEEHNTALMVQHGRTMKEYAQISKTLLSNTQELSVYLKQSLDYVASLKPKPSKKK